MFNVSHRTRTLSQLYTDDGGLSRAETLEGQAAVEQLFSWTAQTLQQLLRAATAANKATQRELEAACRELCEVQQRYLAILPASQRGS